MSNYIVDFEDTLTLEQVQAYCAEKNITIIKHLPTWKNVFIVSADVAPTTDSQLLTVVQDHADGEGIQLLGLEVDLYTESTQTTFDINDEKNWWKTAVIDSIDFDQPIYENTIRGAGSTVYIMDSGIEDAHDEFSNSSIIKFHSFTSDFTDTAGHGTAIASVISGKTCGLTGATVKVVKIFDENVPTKQSDMLIAFNAIAQDFLSCNKPVSIINMSWSIPRNDYINAKIQELSDLGLFLVASAGNSGVPIGDVTPASIPTVFVVGAFDQTLTPCNFSNYTGSDSITNLTANATNHGVLDGWAPGSQIWAAGLGNSYGYVAGTSISAAITSGALAYNLSAYTNESGIGHEFFTTYSGRKTQDLIKQLYRIDVSDSDHALLFKNDPYRDILGKNNLLDLSDPKYADSYNRIIIYKGSAVPSQSQNKKFVVPSNSKYYEVIADRFKVSHLSASDEWPEWVTVDDHGIAEFNAPDITEPYLVLLPKIALVKTNRDGTTSIENITFVVLRNDINKNNINQYIPENDPMLDIVLQIVCKKYMGGVCSGSCSPGSCLPTKSGQCTCQSI